MKSIIFKIVLTGVFCLFFSFNNKDLRYTDIINQDPDPKKESIERGTEIYADYCLRCHLPDGKGIPEETPPLAGSNWLTEKRTESIHAIKFGLKGKIEVNGDPYKGFMPKQKLKAQQVADVMNFIMNSWGNKSNKIITAGETEAVVK